MKKFLLLFAFSLLWITPPAQAQSPSFFTVTQKDGKVWFLSPSGKQFLSMGVDGIGDQSYRAPNDLYYNPVKNQYGGNKQAWVKNVFARLKKWKFNSIGCWGDEDLFGKKFPYTVMLYVGRGNPWDRVLDSVFTEKFETTVMENAKKAAKFRDDPDLIGYFLDNEMPWWGEYGWQDPSQKTLLEKYAADSMDDPNKEALKKFFKDRYKEDVNAFNKVWGIHLNTFEDFAGPVTLVAKTRKQKADANAWAGAVADRYFAVTTKAIREMDPHHLILGVRFAGENPWEVVEACGKYCDVVSVNIYAKTGTADQALLDNFYAKTKKPILITEYSYSALENQSGDPNTHGADVTVPTQKDRVEHLDRFAHQLLNLPYIVGLHWYEWADESPKGRFDGEDQNYGLVDTQDKEYTLITQEHTKLNLAANTLHEKSAAPLPQEFKAPDEATYRKADAGVTVASVKNYLKIDQTAHVDTWGDNANAGRAVANTTSGVIELNFESGTGWGCGASIPSNIGPFISGWVMDLRGYNFFDFKAFVPKGLNFMVYMSESGAVAPGMDKYDGVNGADGESYSFPSYTGTGIWESYRVDLSDLERRTSWGNQHGNQILDMQALSDVQFYIPQNQGSGKMLVKDLEFKVK